MTVYEEMKKGELACIPLSHPEIKVYLQLVYHKKKWISQSMEHFMNLLMERL
jgi:hypothetical protein